MASACLPVDGSSLRAPTGAPCDATAMARDVHLVKNPAIFATITPNSTKSATNPVRLVQKLVHGPASTTGDARLPCAVPCDLLPCSERCKNSLNCGHQCPSICGEVCPSPEFCQVCAPVNGKELNVDYIMGLTYSEVDLNETPLIVPPCEHLMTVESFDGHMSMADHYKISGDGVILAPKASEPFSVKSLKNCPMCRAPLRNIQRYNRIVKRGQIDEATKKFIVWANANFVPLAESLHEKENHLQTNKAAFKIKRNPTADDPRNLFRVDSASTAAVVQDPVDLIIKGTPNEQISKIRSQTGLNRRYKEILKLRCQIQRFLRQVSEAEQPFGRVYDMVQDIRRRRGIETNFPLDGNILQVTSRLRTTALLLRCDLAILSDFTKLHGDHHIQTNSKPYDWMSSPLKLDLAQNRQDCLAPIRESATRQPMHEIEGRIFFARFVALSKSAPADSSMEAMKALVEQARDGLVAAKAICERAASTRSMRGEIEDAENMVKGDTFYTQFTNEEKRAVYAAMAREFTVTGHWYNCENGHPFTIGNCGMPMETSRCPECGAAVGGQNHHAVAGVHRVENIESEFSALGI